MKKKYFLFAFAGIAMLASCGEKAHKHTLEDKPGVEASCERAGSIAYYECQECHQKFYDKMAEKPMEKVDEIAPLGHSYVFHDMVAQSCEKTGVDAYYSCGSCKLIFDESKNKITDIPIIEPHFYDANQDCTICEYHGAPILPECDTFFTKYSGIANKIEAPKKLEVPADAIAISASDALVEIKEAGVYSLEGKYTSGIQIAADVKNVTFILNGCTIQAADASAITADKTKVSIIIQRDSTISNSSENGKSYSAISTKGDLYMQGAGKLTVESKSKTAVDVSGKITTQDANIEISGKNHGMASGAMELFSSTIVVKKAKKDGLQTEAKKATEYSYEKGYIYMKDVNYKSTTLGDGIQADTWFTALGGNLDIKTTGSYVPYAEMEVNGLKPEDFSYSYNPGTDTYTKVAKDQQVHENLHALVQSCKGVKVGAIKDKDGNEIEGDYFIYINDGAKLTVDSTDDCLHTNLGSIILNCECDFISNDDGISCDGYTIIKDGTYKIKSYEAIEGSYTYLYGGIYTLTVYDDGIGASSDDTTVVPVVGIAGGEYMIDCTLGDCIDSNGKLLIIYGNIHLNSHETEGLDSDICTYVNGGTVLGMLKMQITERVFNATQKQNSLLLRREGMSGKAVTVKDSLDKICYTATIQDGVYNCLYFSSSEMNSETEYSFYLDDTLLLKTKLDEVFKEITM